MPVTLAENRYGKSAVRLLAVRRHPDRHEIREVAVDVALEGDFAPAYLDGDNGRVLPTDTMKNTVYALAKEQPFDEIEELGLALARHFVATSPHVTRAGVRLTARPWSRVEVGGAPHPHAFVQSGSERRTAVVTAGRAGVTVDAGIEDLLVLKTTGSGFAGFPRDRYTTLPETSDRILATVVHAEWRYGGERIDFGRAWEGVRRRLIEAFAGHESRSLQHTLWAMGEAVLEVTKEVEEIRLSLPNKHYLLADLARLGLGNDDEVFVGTDEPHGLIEGTLRRS